eukprot:2964922-Ditylum_brightwellii.AAC.1
MSTQLISNSDKLRAEYNPTTPIKKYIAKVEKCMDIAANGSTPYSQEQILTIAFNAMYQTGLWYEIADNYNKQQGRILQPTALFKIIFNKTQSIH